MRIGEKVIDLLSWPIGEKKLNFSQIIDKIFKNINKQVKYKVSEIRKI